MAWLENSVWMGYPGNNNLDIDVRDEMSIFFNLFILVKEDGCLLFLLYGKSCEELALAS